MEKIQYLTVKHFGENKTIEVCVDINELLFVGNDDFIYLVATNDTNGNKNLVDLLTGDEFIIGNKNIRVMPFNDYVLNNLELFDNKVIGMVKDKKSDGEFDTTDFLKKYDCLKNKIDDNSNVITYNLEDGTIVEELTNFVRKEKILDKLLTFDCISEDKLVKLMCDMSLTFETVKRIKKSSTGEVLSNSFVILVDDNPIVEEGCQLTYYYNLGEDELSLKEITSQSVLDSCVEQAEGEAYRHYAFISFEEKKKEKGKVYSI